MKNFSDVLRVKSFFYFDASDQSFPSGFSTINEEKYYLFRVLEASEYDKITSTYWLEEVNKNSNFGHFPSNVTLMYTKVAVLPVDSVHYNLYHKVDVVQLIPDQGAPNKASFLFKDTEVGWIKR
jgi:hypothetical protein